MVVDDEVVVEVVISIVGSPDGCNCSKLSFILMANLVSNLSNSISQIEGHTEAKYKKMEGQNHFHS